MSSISRLALGVSEPDPLASCRQMEANAAARGVHIIPVFPKPKASPELKAAQSPSKLRSQPSPRRSPTIQTRTVPYSFYSPRKYERPRQQYTPTPMSPGDVRMAKSASTAKGSAKNSGRFHGTRTPASRKDNAGSRTPRGTPRQQVEEIRGQKAIDKMIEELFSDAMAKVDTDTLSHGQRLATERNLKKKIENAVREWQKEEEVTAVIASASGSTRKGGDNTPSNPAAGAERALHNAKPSVRKGIDFVGARGTMGEAPVYVSSARAVTDLDDSLVTDQILSENKFGSPREYENFGSEVPMPQHNFHASSPLVSKQPWSELPRSWENRSPSTLVSNRSSPKLRTTPQSKIAQLEDVLKANMDIKNKLRERQSRRLSPPRLDSRHTDSSYNTYEASKYDPNRLSNENKRVRDRPIRKNDNIKQLPITRITDIPQRTSNYSSRSLADNVESAMSVDVDRSPSRQIRGYKPKSLDLLYNGKPSSELSAIHNETEKHHKAYEKLTAEKDRLSERFDELKQHERERLRQIREQNARLREEVMGAHDRVLEAIRSKKSSIDSLQDQLEKELELLVEKPQSELTFDDRLRVEQLESELRIEEALLRDYGVAVESTKSLLEQSESTTTIGDITTLSI